MKYVVRSLKVTWNFIFLILFFTAAFFIVTKAKIIGIQTTYSGFLPYFSSFLGILLIVNRVYLVKGRIKRWPYFLNLLTLFIILVILTTFSGISKNFLDLSFLVATMLSISYFFVSSLFIIPITIEIHNVIQKTHHLIQEVPTIVIRTFILSVLCFILFYPFVVLHIKRLRDIKLSYWWTLLTLIPGINILFEIFLCLKKSAKRSKKSKNKKTSRDKIEVIPDKPNLRYKP